LIVVTAVACGSKMVGQGRSQAFKFDLWYAAFVAQVLLALKGPMPARGPRPLAWPLPGRRVPDGWGCAPITPIRLRLPALDGPASVIPSKPYGPMVRSYGRADSIDSLGAYRDCHRP